jgi:hypothetical protein
MASDYNTVDNIAISHNAIMIQTWEPVHVNYIPYHIEYAIFKYVCAADYLPLNCLCASMFLNDPYSHFVRYLKYKYSYICGKEPYMTYGYDFLYITIFNSMCKYYSKLESMFMYECLCIDIDTLHVVSVTHKINEHTNSFTISEPRRCLDPPV